MSTDKPTPTALAASRVGRLLSGAEPVVTRIEFAPGHEDEAITEQDVAAKLRLMKLAPRMLSATKRARQKLVTYASIYDGDKELRSLLQEWDEILAAAEGRSHQEQS